MTRRWFKRVLRARSFLLGFAATSFMIMVAVAAPSISGASPTDMDTDRILQGPSDRHPFGTDTFGRDTYSRVVHGARISIGVGLGVAVVTAVAGVALGTLAGFYRVLDGPIMRTMDLLMALPAILLAIGVMTILGPQLTNVVIALAIVYTPRTARVVRGSVLVLKGQEFVEAARSLGAGDARVILRHVLPGTVAPLIVQESFIFGYAILAEAGLSFIGVGVPPEFPSWGTMLSEARTLLRTAPWQSLYPGLAISVTVLGINLLGDGLRDIFDPRMQV